MPMPACISPRLDTSRTVERVLEKMSLLRQTCSYLTGLDRTYSKNNYLHREGERERERERETRCIYTYMYISISMIYVCISIYVALLGGPGDLLSTRFPPLGPSQPIPTLCRTCKEPTKKVASGLPRRAHGFASAFRIPETYPVPDGGLQIPESHSQRP